MAVILILGGVTLTVLGMIGEYIGRIYLCLNSSPQYVVREVICGQSNVPPTARQDAEQYE